MIVWLASYPRSGNKFARLILGSLFQAETATVYDRPANATAAEETPRWTGTSPNNDAAIASRDFAQCVFVKTHELPQDSDRNPAICVVRDGRDCLVSYAHYVLRRFSDSRTPPSFEATLKMLIRSREHFGGWSTHVSAWSDREAATTVLRYEDMIDDPAGAISAACRGIGLKPPAPSGALPAFEDLHAKKPQSFRKGRVGSWREEMPAALEELFWSIHGTAMERMGYACGL
ncbi:MAG: sulfotransferase domain-containing protein [Verrucomicrobia bacterium]|nr:sulfotransferase domain-containing protein [Verrucomicrobiota bacterium]